MRTPGSARGAAGDGGPYRHPDDWPTILHADLDSFYASVEQRDDPHLRGRPVVVGLGVVLAASYEAKARGVRTAMGASRARALCPDAIFVSPRMTAYSEASTAVFTIFERTSPVVEALSIDEAFLDVRGLEHILGNPREIAVRLRREVRDEVGLAITVGLAATKFLAKVASAVAKPDGLLVVPVGAELNFLHPLPVERLWGVAESLPSGFTPTGSPPCVTSLASSRTSSWRWWGGRGTPAARPGPQPRSTRGAAATPAALDRRPAGAGSPRTDPVEVRCGADDRRRSGGAAAAGGAESGPDGRAAPAL